MNNATTTPTIITLTKTDSDTLSFFKSIIETSTYTEDKAGIDKCQAIIKQAFEKLGFTVKVLEEKIAGNHLVIDSPAIAKNSTPISEIYTLLAHVDTVHPYDKDFIDLIIKDDGYGYGPGTYDMKGGIATVYNAFRTLSKLDLLNQVPVRFIINSDEENGNIADFRVFEPYVKGSKGCIVLESGRDDDKVILERKGVGTLVIEIEGKSSHAGDAPEKGINAILQAAHTIIEATNLSKPELGTTVSAGLINGGEAINTIAPFAKISFDLRAITLSEFDRLESEVKELENKVAVFIKDSNGNNIAGAKVKISKFRYRPPLEKSSDSLKLYEEYKKVAESFGYNYPLLERVGGGSDANYVSGWWNVPTIDGVGPYGDSLHTKDERVLLSSIGDKAMTLVKFLIDSGRDLG